MKPKTYIHCVDKKRALEDEDNVKKIEVECL